MDNLLLILFGGPTVLGGTVAAARVLVHRHGDPAAAAAYLAWFRAERAAEQAAATRAQHAEPRPATTIRPKELTR